MPGDSAARHCLRYRDVCLPPRRASGAAGPLVPRAARRDSGASWPIRGRQVDLREPAVALLGPTQGGIRLGGVDLRDFPLDDLRRRIAIVQQDNYLFNTSIRENVRIGKPDATDDEIKAAARAANIHEFIVGLPDGYDTVVGERGAKLSGGQRQRLALARAFLKNAPILVLDEATSNLDSENERLIKAAVARLMTGRTTLVIAHRLSTILSADRVVMIDQGQVVASGRHTDLVAAADPMPSSSPPRGVTCEEDSDQHL